MFHGGRVSSLKIMAAEFPTVRDEWGRDIRSRKGHNGRDSGLIKEL